MNTNRKTAIIVGVLYIIGTAAGMLSVAFLTPAVDNPGSLAAVAAHENQILIGALCVLAMGLALAMVPVMLFPILKQVNEALALGYVVFRGALETGTYIAITVSWLLLIILSREYLAAGAPQAAYLQTLGALLPEGLDAISNMVIIVFSLGALMLYALFFRSNLVPRWLSAWGFIAILLHLATGFLILFQRMDGFSPLNLAMEFPIFLQEMVMAAWLIVKGFNSPALAPVPASRRFTAPDTLSAAASSGAEGAVEA